jgi:SAM-dependent methyltransferase
VSAEPGRGARPADRVTADLQTKPLDRLLRRWRIAKATPYVRPGSRVLDIGSGDGALFRRFEGAIGEGIGIDSGLDADVAGSNWRLISGWFPDDLPDSRPFDLITMLAFLEHVPAPDQPGVARACAERLAPGGHLVITVPSTLVDPIVRALIRVRVLHGIGIEQHWGFDPRRTPALFAPTGLVAVKSRRFQLGLNYLYVLRRD